MKAKTILFAPLNATGHINALTGLADQMRQDHQYRTVFLLMGCTTLTSIEQHGHQLMVIDQVSGDLDGEKYTKANEWNETADKTFRLMRMEDPVEAIREILHGPESFGHIGKDQWAKNHEHFARAIELIKPDLIVLDTWTVPPCILQLPATIPWVYVCSANPFTFLRPRLPDGTKPPRMIGASLLSRKERDRLRREQPDKWQTLVEEWRRLGDRIEARHHEHEGFNRLYREHGYEPIEQDYRAYHSPYLNIYIYPKEIDYDQEDDLFEYPPRWFRCDNLIRKSVQEIDSEQAKVWSRRLEEAMEGKEAMVYFSLGTLASGDLDLMRRYLAMFAEDKRRLYVVSKGVRGDELELADNMIGANYVPQTLILQRANLAIVHGGNNTTTECLYFGVPMIVMPCFGDQPDNAQRIEDLNLGRRLIIHKCRRDEVMGAINELLANKELSGRVKTIGRQMRSRDDPRKVSLMLKRLVEEGNLSESFIDYCRNKTAEEIFC